MLRKIIVTFGTRAATAALNFLIVVLLSRFLGAEGKGICSLALSVISVFLIFSNIAGGPTLVFLVPRYKPRTLLLPSYLWALFCAATLLLVLKFYPLIPGAYHTHLSLLCLLHAVASIHQNLLLGRERSGLYNLLAFIQVTVTCATLAVCFFTGRISVGSYLIALYAGFGLSALLSIIMVLRVFQSNEPHAESPLREMFRLGVVNQLAMVAQFMSYRLGFYFLDAWHGASSVGIYSNAVSIAEAVWLIGGSISVVHYARVSNTMKPEEAAPVTAGLARFNFIFTLAAVIPVALLPPSLYAAIFTGEFAAMQQDILLLLPGVLGFSFTMICSNYFAGTGRMHVNTIASLIGFLVVLLSCVLLIPAWGHQGAAIASTLSYLCTTLYIVPAFLRATDLPFRELIPGWREMAEIKKMLTRK